MLVIAGCSHPYPYKMNIEREPYLYKSKKEKSEKYTRPDLIEIKIGEVTKLF